MFSSHWRLWAVSVCNVFFQQCLVRMEIVESRHFHCHRLPLCCSWPPRLHASSGGISWTFKTTESQCDCSIVNIYANDKLVQGVTLPQSWKGCVDYKVNKTIKNSWVCILHLEKPWTQHGLSPKTRLVQSLRPSMHLLYQFLQ